MPTTSYTPTGSFSYTLNGSPLSSFSVVSQDNFVGSLTTTSGGTPTDVDANYMLSHPGVTNTDSDSVASTRSNWAYLQENYGTASAPSFQRYGGFCFLSAPASATDNTGYFSARAVISEGAGHTPRTSLPIGAHAVDITPYVQACVTQATTIDSRPPRRGIPGVKVSVSVTRTGGAAPYPLLAAALTRSSWHFTPSVNYAGTALTYPNSSTWSPEPVSGESRACPCPARAYDPFFGRAASAPRDMIGLAFRLEFPSGRVWTGTSTLGSNGVISAGGGGVLVSVFTSLVGDRMGLCRGVVSSGGGLTGTYNSSSPPTPPTASPSDTDWDAATFLANAADGGDTLYDGEKTNGGTITEVTPLTFTAGGATYNIMRILRVFPLPTQTFIFDLDSSFDTSLPPAAPSGTGFRNDATGRASFLSADSTGVRLLTTKDAGHTYDSYSVTSGAAADGNLLIDPATNLHRAIYTNAPAGTGSSMTASFFTSAATKDGEQGDWSASASLATLTGAFPVVAQHPEDPTRAACLTLDAGTLKAWVSYDTGATWQSLSASVATGLDFSASGRAGLCWLGENLCAVYASGNNLLSKVSSDGGHTWPGTAVTVATAGPYSGLSCVGLLGTFYALAFYIPSGGTAATASRVFASGGLGASGTWAATASDPTGLTAGSGLGYVAENARLLLGVTKYSADGGASWPSD